MARAFVFCATALLLILVVLSPALALENGDAKADISGSLQHQIETLAKQIKDAEAGKAQAQKLLDAGKAKQESFSSEIKLLKASLEDKDKQGSALQKQLSLLQDEAAKLKADEALHAELKEQFRAVGEELETTKLTLADTLKQLADRGGQAAAAQTQLAEAEKNLETARQERDAARDKLADSENSATDAAEVEKHLKKEKAKSQKLAEELAGVKGQAKELKATLQAAAKEGASWKSKAEKAERALASAEKQLEKAMQDQSATQSALIKAEAKAEEVAKNLEILLTSWLPHWLEQWYIQLSEAVRPAVAKVQPAVESAWRQGKEATSKGKAKALWAVGVTRAKSVAAWKNAKPTVDKALSNSQKQLSSFSAKARKTSAPYLRRARVWTRRTFKIVQRYAAEFASHPQVLNLRRKAQQAMHDLEDALIAYLKRVPLLKPYARRPTVTYILCAIVAAPVITLLVPLLSLRRTKQKPVQYETRKISKRDNYSPEQPKPKPKKARRISVGDEHIRVP